MLDLASSLLSRRRRRPAEAVGHAPVLHSPPHASRQHRHLCFGLLQIELHVHLAIRGRRGDEMFLRVLTLVGASVERAEAEVASIWNLSLDELRQKSERFLPTETASLRRNDIWQPFLHDAQLGSAGHLLQGDRRPHLAG